MKERDEGKGEGAFGLSVSGRHTHLNTPSFVNGSTPLTCMQYSVTFYSLLSPLPEVAGDIIFSTALEYVSFDVQNCPRKI